MRTTDFRRFRHWVLPALGVFAIAILGATLGFSRHDEPADELKLASAAPANSDRPYLEWVVTDPIPEPTDAPAPSTKTDDKGQAPATDENELLASLSAGPAQVADARRDIDAPSPTTLASNLSPGERARLLRADLQRERPARRPVPRFTVAIVEDNCEPPGRTSLP